MSGAAPLPGGIVAGYDKPPLETMTVNPGQEERNRQIYKAYFGICGITEDELVSSFSEEIEEMAKGRGMTRGENPDPIPLFYQSGYLTICGFDREFRIYSLAFPNDEVKYGFLQSLAPYVLGDEDAERRSRKRGMRSPMAPTRAGC